MGGAMRAGVAAAMAVFLAVAVSGAAAAALPRFAEAPEYRNGEGCPAVAVGVCDPGLVHIAMTLDAHYLRGSMAAAYSLLKHASCPESIFFHFLAAEAGGDGSGSGPPQDFFRKRKKRKATSPLVPSIGSLAAPTATLHASRPCSTASPTASPAVAEAVDAGLASASSSSREMPSSPAVVSPAKVAARAGVVGGRSPPVASESRPGVKEVALEECCSEEEEECCSEEVEERQAAMERTRK